jgi:hypothetical protein
MTFDEWWMDQEYDPMLYGPLSEVWNAAQSEQREIDARIVETTPVEWPQRRACAIAIRNHK